MSVTHLGCDFVPERDGEILRSVKTLTYVNDQPVKEFWEGVETRRVASEAWLRKVADLSAEKRLGAVADRLQELNPGFVAQRDMAPDGGGGAITELAFPRWGSPTSAPSVR